MRTTGIGVIDTSSLWAAGVALEGLPSPSSRFHPRRLLPETKQEFFVSLMHNLNAIRAEARMAMDLFSKLGLPKSGYDFSGLILKPLSLSDLGRAIAHVSLQEAIDKVLTIRETDAAQEVRRAWANRLWSAGPHAVEGYSKNKDWPQATQNASDMVVVGNFYQIQIMGAPFGSNIEPEMKSVSKDVLDARRRVLEALSIGNSE